jgi:hypothetical protein
MPRLPGIERYQILEVEFTGELNLAWIVHGGTHFAEGRRIAHVARRVGEVRMVEQIEELKTQLDLSHLSQRELLEEAHIQILAARTMEQPRSARTEGTRAGNRKPT